MADIAKITLPNGSSYNFKDSVARSELAGKAASSHKHTKSEITDFPTVLTGGSQTTTSTADGGSNVFTFNKSDGTTTTLTVKNGSKGSTGATGAIGPQGPKGASGTSAAWFSGTAVTGTSTSAVTVSVSGSKAGDMYLNSSTYNVYRASAANSWIYVCNIKGATGATGAKGPKGDTGATGAQGLQGPQGPAGINATTTAVATTSANGLMSSADKKKLDGIAAGANAYSHPTSSGNKHIPSGGSSGQILRWSADGTAVWGADNNTTYSAMTGATSSADGSTGLVPAPAKGASNRYLRSDGTWQVPPDTNTTYTLAGLMGSSAKGSATQPIYWNGSAWTNTTYTLGKSVPSNAVFTDTNTHYTTHLYAGTSSGTANASTTNGNTYLILTDDSTARNRIKIAGSGATSVASDASGNITISSTNTTYSAATTSANGLMTSAMVTKLNGIATGATKNSINTYDVSIAVADWATNSNGGYKCTKTVSGILATDEIFADVSLSSDVAAAKLQVAAWACVCNGNIFNSANNTVDFYCYDTKPSAALTIRLTVVR